MTITSNLQFIQQQLPKTVKLVAVSKTKSTEQILEAYEAGQRLFGENKVQELISKWQLLPKDIEWHFIGHLQSNKVKPIIPFISLIHGVDSFRLLSTINKEAEKMDLVVSVLLEFHIAEEESKFGLSFSEAEEMLSSVDWKSLKNISVKGVMGMATFTTDEKVIKTEFERLSSIFRQLKEKYFHDSESFCELSMGMSDDYLIAISAGSTLVRLGSKIFGNR